MIFLPGIVLLLSWLVILYAMFREERWWPLHCILGFLVPFYAMLWGWFRWDGDMKLPIMGAFTGALLLGIVFAI